MIRNKMPLGADKMPAYHIIAHEIYRYLKRTGLVTVRNRRQSVQSICTLIYNMDKARYDIYRARRFDPANYIGQYDRSNPLVVCINELTYISTFTTDESKAIRSCYSYLGGEI